MGGANDEAVYEIVELDQMQYVADTPYGPMYYYDCPCGDRFEIGLEDLRDGEDIADCPSCTLKIKVIYDMEKLPEIFEEQGLEHIPGCPFFLTCDTSLTRFPSMSPVTALLLSD
ncbi:unnamed protein product [Chrysoparadoxa australica]